MAARPSPADSQSHAPRWPGSASDRTRVWVATAWRDARAREDLAKLFRQRNGSLALWAGGPAERGFALAGAGAAEARALEVELGSDADADAWERIRARAPRALVLAVVREADFQAWLGRALRCARGRAEVALEDGKLAIVDVDAGGAALRGLI